MFVIRVVAQSLRTVALRDTEHLYFVAEVGGPSSVEGGPLNPQGVVVVKCCGELKFYER
jgi:hypothetical protein